jgi:hypothetical protein
MENIGFFITKEIKMCYVVFDRLLGLITLVIGIISIFQGNVTTGFLVLIISWELLNYANSEEIIWRLKRVDKASETPKGKNIFEIDE